MDNEKGSRRGADKKRICYVGNCCVMTISFVIAGANIRMQCKKVRTRERKKETGRVREREKERDRERESEREREDRLTRSVFFILTTWHVQYIQLQLRVMQNTATSTYYSNIISWKQKVKKFLEFNRNCTLDPWCQSAIDCITTAKIDVVNGHSWYHNRPISVISLAYQHHHSNIIIKLSNFHHGPF